MARFVTAMAYFLYQFCLRVSTDMIKALTKIYLERKGFVLQFSGHTLSVTNIRVGSKSRVLEAVAKTDAIGDTFLTCSGYIFT